MKTDKIGLIGHPLGHSYSPAIHKMLGRYPYVLCDVAPENIPALLADRSFRGFNVTIPYKKTVMPYLDGISDEAARIGSVNTILRLPDGKLWGENTDYFGFIRLLEEASIDLGGQKVLILGSGGAGMTARTVAADKGAREIVIVSRSGEDNYENIGKHADADIIINTTPVGMYPENGKTPVDLSGFRACRGVVDLIYNPCTTRLLSEARAAGIPAAGGLTMLVGQAIKSNEIFFGKTLPQGTLSRVTRRIAGDMRNVVLIGMPGSGKTTIGKALAKRLGRPFFDTDEIFLSQEGVSAGDYIKTHGEADFRAKESAIVAAVGKMSGAVIATGGGVPTVPANFPALGQNGTIIFLKREPGALATAGRPLSEDLEGLYRERLPKYEAFADHAIKNHGTPRAVAASIAALIKKEETQK